MKKRTVIPFRILATLLALRGLADATPPEKGVASSEELVGVTTVPSASQPRPGSPPAGKGTRGFHPDAPYTTAEAFSKAIGSQAVMLDSPKVSILAPKRREQAAAVVLPYLVRAYDEPYRIVGVHTKYKILVYAYPKGTPGVRGGTSGCVIKYTDENLDLASQYVRYRLTVECFDRLPGLNFEKLLEQSGISTTIAIQSLKPTQPGWNRKLQ
jgi:hypothetical protein